MRRGRWRRAARRTRQRSATRRSPHPRAIPGYAAKKAPWHVPYFSSSALRAETLASWRVGARRSQAAAASGEREPRQAHHQHGKALELGRRQPGGDDVVAAQELDEEPLRAREHEIEREQDAGPERIARPPQGPRGQ